jgi:hypothetical protein
VADEAWLLTAFIHNDQVLFIRIIIIQITFSWFLFVVLLYEEF